MCKKIIVQLISMFLVTNIFVCNGMTYSAEEVIESKGDVGLLDESDEDKFHWEVNSNYELLITLPVGEMSGQIPDYFKRYKNPDIMSSKTYLEDFIAQPWKKYSDKIKSIKICDGITDIGGYAFFEMPHVECISIADSVKAIGKKAFSGTNIKSITLPANVTSLNESVFENCKSLENVNFNESIITIGNMAFSDCISMTELNLPDSLKTIGEFAFKGCIGLTSIVIPDSITAMNRGAFYGCTKIKNVDFGDGLTEISWECFRGCAAISQLDLRGTTIKRIRNTAFSECTSLNQLFISDDFESIGNGAFENCTEIREITVLNPDMDFAPDAGLGNKNNDEFVVYGIPGSTAWKYAQINELKFIVIEGYEDKIYPLTDTLTWSFQNKQTLVISGEGDIPDYTMEDDDVPPWYEYKNKIKEVYIEGGVTGIGENALSGLGMANEISMPSTLKRIGKCALKNCAYREIVIPENVEDIGAGAFSYCPILKTAIVNCKIKSLETKTFEWCTEINNIILPEGLENISDEAFACCQNIVYADTLIPDSVKTIGKGVFLSCSNLKSLKIPDGVTKIEEDLCLWCHKLETVDLPNSIEIIGESAFKNCESLKNISIGNNVCEIKAYAFADCTSLVKVDLCDNLEKICDHAFENCGLLGNVIIPESVNSIGSSAFLDCKNVSSYTILNPDLNLSYVRMGYVRNEDEENKNHIFLSVPTTFYGYINSKTESYAKRSDLFAFNAVDNVLERGDINLDRKVNISDLVLLQNYITGTELLNIKQLNNADINNDNNADVFDAIMLKRYLIDVASNNY